MGQCGVLPGGAIEPVIRWRAIHRVVDLDVPDLVDLEWGRSAAAPPRHDGPRDRDGERHAFGPARAAGDDPDPHFVLRF
jgi:hypothetical protein